MNRRSFVKELAAFTAATMVGGALIDALPEIPKSPIIPSGEGLLATIEKSEMEYELLTNKRLVELVQDLIYKQERYNEECQKQFYICTSAEGIKMFRRMERKAKFEYWLNKLFGI